MRSCFAAGLLAFGHGRGNIQGGMNGIESCAPTDWGGGGGACQGSVFFEHRHFFTGV